MSLVFLMKITFRQEKAYLTRVKNCKSDPDADVEVCSKCLEEGSHCPRSPHSLYSRQSQLERICPRPVLVCNDQALTWAWPGEMPRDILTHIPISTNTPPGAGLNGGRSGQAR